MKESLKEFKKRTNPHITIHRQPHRSVVVKNKKMMVKTVWSKNRIEYNKYHHSRTSTRKEYIINGNSYIIFFSYFLGICREKQIQKNGKIRWWVELEGGKIFRYNTITKKWR